MKKENEHIYLFTGTSETLAPVRGYQVRQRQYDRQTRSYQMATTDQVVSPQETVPNPEMIGNPISGNPIIPYQSTPSTNSQLQKNVNRNMIQRLKRRSPSPSVRRNIEGNIIITNYPNY